MRNVHALIGNLSGLKEPNANNSTEKYRTCQTGKLKLGFTSTHCRNFIGSKGTQEQPGTVVQGYQSPALGMQACRITGSSAGRYRGKSVICII